MSHAVNAGPWNFNPKNTLPANPDFANHQNLELWSAEIRSSVFVFDLIEGLSVTSDSKKKKVSLKFPASSDNTVAEITRPSEAVFAKQLTHLDYYADQRFERTAEILAQISDILSFFGAVAHMQPEQKRWTHELLIAALKAAALIELQFKHLLACRRPVEYHHQIQPMIQTPPHSSYPSGHATEAFVVATILRGLIARRYKGTIPPEWTHSLLKLAVRIAQNRTVAGVHFPVDSAAGAALGASIGGYFLAKLDSKYKSPCGWSVIGDYFGAADFTIETVSGIYSANTLTTEPSGTVFAKHLKMSLETVSDSRLTWLWNKAAAEWK
jgi:membrane-associated phospholipid phosphatase